MEVIISIGVVGSVASIIGLFLPANRWQIRAMHVIYGLVIAILASLVISYQYKFNREHGIERAGYRLLQKEGMMSHEGFINACLAFLEKYRNDFPDAYIRAQKICDLNESFISPHRKVSGESFDHASSITDVAYELSGLIEGISIMSQDSESQKHSH